MDTLIEQLPKFADLIQKSGVVGLLLIICGVLVNEVRRLRKTAAQVYAERDGYRLAYVIYKGACDGAGLRPDLTALHALPFQLPSPPGD